MAAPSFPSHAHYSAFIFVCTYCANLLTVALTVVRENLAPVYGVPEEGYLSPVQPLGNSAYLFLSKDPSMLMWPA